MRAGSLDPERLDVIWGRTRPRTRGPKASLTVPQITGAAVQLADDSGLEAVSMKRVADALSVGTMTLYTYVPDKATLLHLMLDQVVAEASLPDAATGWREHLVQAAEALVELYQRHPWMLQINVDGPPMTPNQVRFLESLLASLRGTGLTHKESLDIAMSISYYALGAAKLTTGLVQAAQESELSVAEIGVSNAEMFARLLDPAEFPAVREAMSPPPDQSVPTELWESLGFRFGLDRLIDGIGAYIEARSRSNA